MFFSWGNLFLSHSLNYYTQRDVVPFYTSAQISLLRFGHTSICLSTSFGFFEGTKIQYVRIKFKLSGYLLHHIFPLHQWMVKPSVPLPKYQNHFGTYTLSSSSSMSRPSPSPYSYYLNVSCIRLLLWMFPDIHLVWATKFSCLDFSNCFTVAVVMSTLASLFPTIIPPIV